MSLCGFCEDSDLAVAKNKIIVKLYRIFSGYKSIDGKKNLTMERLSVTKLTNGYFLTGELPSWLTKMETIQPSCLGINIKKFKNNMLL